MEFCVLVILKLDTILARGVNYGPTERKVLYMGSNFKKGSVLKEQLIGSVNGYFWSYYWFAYAYPCAPDN